MKKFCLLLLMAAIDSLVFSQSPADSLLYRKMSYMIPMRDGVMLNTIVLTPVDQHRSFPFLINRTPYGIDGNYPVGNQVISLADKFLYYTMAKDGYIFVFQ